MDSDPATGPDAAGRVRKRAMLDDTLFSMATQAVAGMPDVQCRLYRSPLDGWEDRVFLRLPSGPGRPWVVVLHGHGSLGDQLFVREDIRRAWLPVFVEHDVGILAPDLRGNAWMGPAAEEDLNRQIAAVREAFDVPVFGLVGGSMGGTGVLIYAGLHPEDVGGVVAYCPATDLADLVGSLAAAEKDGGEVIGEIRTAIEAAYGPAGRSDTYARHSILANHRRLTMPVAVIHGDRDAMIPVSHARRLRERMGPRLGYREIAGGDHDAPLTCVQPLRELMDHLQA
ncbi:MAG: alpha/beta hydrolase [Planctomycetes bacterium]|nr:alpha/beta hydrolase [Planctomycetota bacterium]